MRGLLALLPFLRGERWQIVAAFFCMAIYAFATAVYAFISGPALTFVFSGNPRDVILDKSGAPRKILTLLPKQTLDLLVNLNANDAWLLLPTLIVGTAVIKGGAQAGQFYLMGRAAQGALRRLREAIFGRLVNHGPRFYQNHSHGDILSRLTHDAGLIEAAAFYGVGPVLREPLVLLSLLGYLFFSNPGLALFTIFVLPLSLLPLLRFAAWLKRVSRKSQRSHAEIQSVSHEVLSGLTTVQAFGQEQRERQRLGAAGLSYYRQMCQSYLIRAARTPIMEVLGAAALAALLIYLGDRVRTHGDDPGQYVSFIAAFFFMYDPLKKLGRVSDHLAAGDSAAERVLDLLQAPPEVSDAPNAVELTNFNSRLHLDAVSFAYADDVQVLNDLEFEVKRGETVALVGGSGAGKTTIANLILRLFDVDNGAITIDGVDVRGVTRDSLRRLVSVVSQETFLFNATIAENIAYGCETASEAKIVAAARAAHADEFIARLGGGYQTVVGERGAMLSGGQRQRLSIARALLTNAPIIIFDEATSNLDAESEELLTEAMEGLFGSRTMLVIAHRLSTVRRADRICVLAAGKVVESGTHEELIAKSGRYEKLCRLQFGSQIAPDDPTQKNQQHTTG